MSLETIEYTGDDEPTQVLHRIIHFGKDFNLTDMIDSTDRFYDARSLLTTVVQLDQDTSLIKKRFSQTPLSPSTLIEVSNFSYLEAVTSVLDSRVAERSRDLNLHSFYSDAIEREISLELFKRIKSNDEAGARLLRLLQGKKVTANEADLIWRAKTGEATLSETGELLLRYPEIESIEAMKYTEPLDWQKISKADVEMMKGLGEFFGYMSQPGGHGLSLNFYPNDENHRNRRPLVPKNIPNDDYQAALQAAIAGWKENVAEIRRDDVTIQLVQKTTTIKIDPNEILPGVEQKLVPYRGITTNLQPVAKSWYWRVKPQGQ